MQWHTYFATFLLLGLLLGLAVGLGRVESAGLDLLEANGAKLTYLLRKMYLSTDICRTGMKGCFMEAGLV